MLRNPNLIISDKKLAFKKLSMFSGIATVNVTGNFEWQVYYFFIAFLNISQGHAIKIQLSGDISATVEG